MVSIHTPSCTMIFDSNWMLAKLALLVELVLQILTWLNRAESQQAWMD